MKNLTPKAMRCDSGWCPSVGQLEDGRLLIVGKIAPWLEVNEDSSPVDRESWTVSVGTDETAVIIDPALLDDFVAGKVREERAAWRETMKGLGPWLRQAKEDGDLDTLIEGNIWPEPLCVISEADVQKSIEIAKKIRPQIEAEKLARGNK